MAKVRIGKLLLEFDSDDELDRFVSRHAGSDQDLNERPSGDGAQSLSQPPASAANRSMPSGQGDRDQALLRSLLAAGEMGVESSTVSGLLGGVQGRSVPGAVCRWAVRVGLAESEDNQALVQARPGGRRGWRLSPSALGAARALGGSGS